MTLEELQALIDASFDVSSEHLRSIMTEPRRLTAERLVALVECPAVLSLATVTASGQPRLSAVDGHLIDGAWHFTTAADSPKALQLRARPRVSVSWTPRDGLGVFARGTAVVLEGAEQQRMSDHFALDYGVPPESMGDVFSVRVDADWLVGFAMTPDEDVLIAEAAAARAERRRAASA